MKTQLVLVILLIFILGLSSESSVSYNSETSENVLSDNIIEKVGNSEVEVIDGNYSGNQTKIRTARRYYGGRGWRRRYYGGWGRRRYYSFYRPRYYYYGGYYGSYGYGYGYGYGYYSYYYKA
ncbi:Protein CBG15128 [Caenorhabditis briggsae]|uniref:Uncharacterized protein n=2 Tax=Caenorhabditis briggsae TaxID=6238 RepID=A0AAE9D8J5_CAEBR|nr:Protein CBG15128 [Caenorhabditis briggsae]ULT98594.1 hypothetical protein L3Y34_000157 [Caenorhabditis briggsae]CAP33616.1 Protein CBG15128 [Caenorhabditis briggsae]